MCTKIYQRAIKDLFHKTYGRLEDRDRIVVAQLFDKLLERGYKIHVDDVTQLCKEIGYDEYIAKDIHQIYDDLLLFREELRNPKTIDYWPNKIFKPIIAEDS